MKNVVILFFILFLAGSVAAQVPNAINYQAVARNNNGQALSNQTIKVRLSILKGGTSLYSETRTVTTNGLGLFNVQIGSPGATATTGVFGDISWPNNQPSNKVIKVELDITNTNIFTDMGTQELATVPYSFAAGQAINAINIGGNYVDTATPQTNDILKWNGSAWVPAAVPLAPTSFSVASSIPNIPFGDFAAPWTVAGSFATVTVVHGQTITANFVGVFGHSHSNPQPVSFAVCYQQVVNGVPSGIIYPFQNTNYTSGTLTPLPIRNVLSATGAVKVVTGTTIPAEHQIPPGTYRVFMGIKNTSAVANISANDYVNGTIIVF